MATSALGFRMIMYAVGYIDAQAVMKRTAKEFLPPRLYAAVVFKPATPRQLLEGLDEMYVSPEPPYQVGALFYARKASTRMQMSGNDF